jgi:alpha-tubulin suppressor-like RCC1 family protein
MRGSILALALFTGAAWVQAQNLAGVKAIVASGNTSYALLSDGTVWGWGEDDAWDEILGGGQTRPLQVSGLTDVVVIGPGLALKADGTVWGHFIGTNSVRVPELSGVIAVASGAWYSNLALTGDGNVWVFGSPGNANGRAEWSPYNTVTRVSGLTEIAAIAAGTRNSLALKRDGTVWMWGDNLDGSMGDGLIAPPSSPDGPILLTPAQVTGLSDVVAVVAGYGHSLALKSDGTVWAWGFNGHGQLGDGTTETRAAPIQVSGLGGVVKIAAGDAHSVAVKGDGTVWAWGSNVGGQLGDGTTTDRPTPLQVSGLSGIAGIAAGRYHTLAVNQDGTVWAWGDDQFGQLGDAGEVLPGPLDAPLGPVQVGGLAGVTKIAAGSTHSLAMKSDGTLWAWGDNTYGQLGDGQIRGADWPDRSTPVKVSGPAGVAAITGGYGVSLAVTADGSVWMWGANVGIRDGYPAPVSTPVQVSGLAGVVSVKPSICGYYPERAAYPAVGCYLVLREDGSIWEWGVWYGPAPMAGIGGVQMVAASWDRNVALKRDGTVWEWAVPRPAPPSPGSPAPPATPTQVSGLSDVIAVAAQYHSLALERDGTVWAWGTNNCFGELGDGTTPPPLCTGGERTTPVQVAGLTDVVAIDTRADEMFIGFTHSLALKRDGTVWEWPILEFKPYRAAKSLVPVQVAGLCDIVAIAEGGGHSLALKRDGTVWAWGQNIYGQLGVRTFAVRTTPVQVVAPAAP